MEEADHVCGKQCNHVEPVPLQETLSELEFNRSLCGALSRGCSLDTVEQFVRKDPRCVMMVDSNGYTPLHYAVRRGDPTVCQLLIELNPAAVNQETKAMRYTPLQRAARFGHIAVVKMLLAAGARCEPRDHGGKNAVEQAELEGHADVVTLLQQSK